MGLFNKEKLGSMLNKAKEASSKVAEKAIEVSSNATEKAQDAVDKFKNNGVSKEERAKQLEEYNEKMKMLIWK